MLSAMRARRSEHLLLLLLLMLLWHLQQMLATGLPYSLACTLLLLLLLLGRHVHVHCWWQGLQVQHTNVGGVQVKRCCSNHKPLCLCLHALHDCYLAHVIAAPGTGSFICKQSPEFWSYQRTAGMHCLLGCVWPCISCHWTYRMPHCFHVTWHIQSCHM